MHCAYELLDGRLVRQKHLIGGQPGSRADAVKFRMADGRLEVAAIYLNGRRVF